MNSYLYLILFAVMIFMTIQNFKKIKENQNDANYVESYRKVINREEDALDFINDYLSKETNPGLKVKTAVIELCELLEKNEDVSETMELIDFKVLFGDGNINQMVYEGQSDVFLWVMAVMAKANRLGRKDIIETLYNKLNEVKGLDNYMEYKLTVAYYNVFMGNKDLSFIDKLLNGEYGDVLYNKRTIGLNKRFGESLKAYAGEELDDLSRMDIPAFAGTALGDYLLRDLGIYDQYAEESKEESTTEYLDTLNNEEETDKNEEE